MSILRQTKPGYAIDPARDFIDLGPAPGRLTTARFYGAMIEPVPPKRIVSATLPSGGSSRRRTTEERCGHPIRGNDENPCYRYVDHKDCHRSQAALEADAAQRRARS